MCRDIAPMGETLVESNSNLDELAEEAQRLQQATGVSLLWATSNLFADPVYANGSITSPDAHVFAMAAAQVKKGLEVAKKLGAQGFGECCSYVLCIIIVLVQCSGVAEKVTRHCSTLT